jgi:hypothetical protein
MLLLFEGVISATDVRVELACGRLLCGRMRATSCIDEAKETEPCARAMARDQIWPAVLAIREWNTEARRRACAIRESLGDAPTSGIGSTKVPGKANDEN